jgi:diguanylate cyclase (GGDEF)-like protein/PAS domain S-box-containing protein
MQASDFTLLTDIYPQLLDISSDPVFCFAPDFRYLYVNQAYADGIGRSPDEIVGRTVWDVFPKDEADKRSTLIARVFDHGEAKTHELLVRGRDVDRHYLTTLTPVFGDQGRVRFVLGNSKDITELRQAESVLKASEEKYRALVETTSTGYLILDIEGKVIDANSEYVRLTGYSDLGEILGRSVLEWTAEHEFDRNSSAVAQCARDGFIRNLVVDYVDRNGRVTPCEINATVIGEGDRAQILALCRDITERRRAEAAQGESEAYTRSILDSVPDQIAVIDQDGVIVRVNEPWRRASRERSSERGTPAPDTDVGTNYMDVWLASTGNDAQGSKAAREGIKAVLEGTLPSFAMDYPCHFADQKRWFTMRASPLGGSQRGAVIAHTDISERMSMEQHIRELAFHDPLTQLPNRRLACDRLTQAMVSGKRSGLYGALMFLDLDNLKTLNDAHGHEVGDFLLIETAKRLTACVRAMDTVARFGGDEFVVMLSELAPEREASTALARSAAERIRIALSEPYQLAIKHDEMAATAVHRCTTSIGVALFIGHEASPDEVLKWADAAMYHAKESGGNSVRVYEPTTSAFAAGTRAPA